MSETIDGARPGSAVDLSRRMDRIEAAQERQAQDVANLAGTVARVELNQVHAEELNKLRFGALDQSVQGLTLKLDAFMARVEGLITGEVTTQSTRERLAEYVAWRETVDDRLDASETLATQVRLLGRLAIFLTGGSLLGALGALVAIYSALHR